MIFRFFLTAIILALICGRAQADLGKMPYNPATDKAKLASDLGIADSEILLDRKCVFSKTNSWVASAPLAAFKQCVLVLTDSRLVLSTFDATENRYINQINYPYSDLQEIALREDISSRVELEAEEKKYQVQFVTKDGFISISAYRAKIDNRLADSAGAKDAFEIIRDKGVPVVESVGRIELSMPNTPSWFLKKR